MGSDVYGEENLVEGARSFFEELETRDFTFLRFYGPDDSWYDSIRELDDSVGGRGPLPEETFIRYRGDVEIPEQENDDRYEPEMAERDVTGKIVLVAGVDRRPLFEARVSYPHYIRRSTRRNILRETATPAHIQLSEENGDFRLRYERDGGLDPEEVRAAGRETLELAQEIIDGLAETKKEDFFE